MAELRDLALAKAELEAQADIMRSESDGMRSQLATVSQQLATFQTQCRALQQSADWQLQSHSQLQVGARKRESHTELSSPLPPPRLKTIVTFACRLTPQSPVAPACYHRHQTSVASV